MRILLITAAAALLSAGSAFAQDFYVYGGAALQFSLEPDGSGSGTKSDINGYVEVEKSGLYAGIWAEISNQSDANEVDLYVGYRGETGVGLSYDVNYYRYFYPNDGGDCCGELGLVLGKGFGDALSGSVSLAYDPQAELGNAYLGVEYAATDALTLSANYGFYDVDSATVEQEWDVGVGYAVGEETAVELRYYDGTDYTDGYLRLQLSWDTTILAR